MPGQERDLLRQQYRQEQNLAYRRLRNPHIIPGDPIGTIGGLFPDIALTEAQSGQTPAHVFGLMSMRLVASGETTWRELATASLSPSIARRMALRADSLHGQRHITVPDIIDAEKEARIEFLARNTANVFGFFMDHVFHNIATLSPEGAEALGARIAHNQGITHPANGPQPREVTLPFIESYLADPTTFQNVQNLLQASTDALLAEDGGRPIKDAFLDRLEEIGREHIDDDPANQASRETKQRKDMQARADMWHATYPLIREAINDVTGFTTEQLDNFAWNSSLVFVTLNDHLAPPPPTS